MAQRLKQKYSEEIRAALLKEFSYRNVMEVPRITKVVVNIGLGEALQNAKALDAASGDLRQDYGSEADYYQGAQVYCGVQAS